MKTIAIFVHHPYCSVQSTNGIIAALDSDYRFKLFTKHPLPDNFFRDVDMVAVPGGLGDADNFSKLMVHNGESIKHFVQSGGAYLGICMGAYWAGKHYFDLVDSLDIVQYIRRPLTDTRRPHAKALDVLWQKRREKMFFYDGCSIIGKGPKRVWANYMNGDPMAVIQGRIGLIGCHPESDEHWYNSYTWMRKHSQLNHYQLLKNFVDSIMTA